MPVLVVFFSTLADYIIISRTIVYKLDQLNIVSYRNQAVSDHIGSEPGFLELLAFENQLRLELRKLDCSFFDSSVHALSLTALFHCKFFLHDI
jgi:hypothetical protein